MLPARIYPPYWQMEWWHVNTAQVLIVRTMIEPKADLGGHSGANLEGGSQHPQ